MLFKRPNMKDFKHCFYFEESCITLPGLGRLTEANLPQPCPIIQVQRSLHPDDAAINGLATPSGRRGVLQMSAAALAVTRTSRTTSALICARACRLNGVARSFQKGNTFQWLAKEKCATTGLLTLPQLCLLSWTHPAEYPDIVQGE